MIVSIEQFQKYSNVFTDNEELQKSYLTSAQNIICDYLGYNIQEKILDNKTGRFKNIAYIKEFPEIIILTIMRIAAVLQTEGDSNIGITSKSFGDSGSRTFINTVNFDKYLIQVSQYRTIRI